MHLIPDLGNGGAERLVLNLATHADRTRFDVSVISMFAPGDTTVERELSTAGVPVVFLEKRPGFDPRMFWRIRRALASIGPDVLHTHRYVLQYALPTLFLDRRFRAVHTVHNLASLEVPWAGQAAHRLALRAGVSFVAIGGVVGDSFKLHYGRNPRATIPNGVPVARYAKPSSARAEWRRAASVDLGRILFVCVARLQPQKNLPLLLRAFREVRRGSQSPVTLAIVGDGPLKGMLQDWAAANGCAEDVRFLGSRNDVPDVLGAADAFVLSSDWEGNPLSVMEAMAAGLPVVATSVGGVPELVKDRVTGLLTPPGDADRLAAAMLVLLRDSGLRATMGEAARKRAAEEFDVSVAAARYGSLYKELGRSRR